MLGSYFFLQAMVHLEKNQMENSTQMSSSKNLKRPVYQEQLTLAAQRLKERLSHLPAYQKQDQESGDAFWAALSSSRATI